MLMIFHSYPKELINFLFLPPAVLYYLTGYCMDDTCKNDCSSQSWCDKDNQMYPKVVHYE